MSEPALAGKVNWTTIEDASEHWDYKQHGLTKEGAVIIAVVVALVTNGAASGLGEAAAVASGEGVALTSGGVFLTGTGGVIAAGTAAGVTALSSRAAVSLINNQGNVGKTLKDLGSSDSIRQTIAAMLTAGVGTALPSNSFAGVAAQTATGCATGAMAGIGCEQGATNAAITSGAAFAYSNTVGYAANAGPGFQADDPVYEVDKTPGSPVYGQQPLASQGANVIGLNRPGAFFSQGGTTSNLLNRVPFINATAGFHDWIFNASPTLYTWFPVLNVPTMIPATLISIPAAINDPSLSWMFVNGSPYTLITPPRPLLIPSIVRLPGNGVWQPVKATDDLGAAQ